jgi:hypothetical protein
MVDQKRSRLVLSRPKDESFEAYRSWIENTFSAMSGVAGAGSSEEKLRSDWRKFWGTDEEGEKVPA